MTSCKKCGYDEDAKACPFCGAPDSQTLGNYGGKLLTICCRKDPNKTARGGK